MSVGTLTTTASESLYRNGMVEDQQRRSNGTLRCRGADIDRRRAVHTAEATIDHDRGQETGPHT